MRRVNIADPTFAYEDDDPAGFRSGMARYGPDLEAEQMGTSVYELPPGQALCPYHYEYAEEECLLVLAGRPTVRDPDGETVLEPWDLVMFPTGPEGAHNVRNESNETVRVLMYSTVITPAITVYPDSDKVGVWTGNEADNGTFPRSASVEYFDGETGAGRGPRGPAR